MKVLVNVALEFEFSGDDEEEIKTFCKDSNKQLEQHFTEAVKGILVDDADIDPGFIKAIKVENIEL